jgi:glycosyltransferase involved in cell wall biosynthesis
MRVLLAAHQTQGGIGTLAQGLADALPAAIGPGDELDVVRGWRNRSFQESRVGRIAFEQVRLAMLARRYDLLHLCDYRPVLLSRSRFLLTIHDVFFLDNPEWFPRQVARYKTLMLDRALKKRPAQIVCVSEWTRKRLLKLRPGVDPEVVVVAPSGIVQPQRITYRPDLERPYFLTVSTIEPRKNHLGLLRAFRRVRRAGLDIVWRIAGPPGYASDPIVAELRREAGVVLHGRVSESEKESLFAEALFAAVPSLAEGFGFPPLEAMARGVPVVCSTGSALDETVGDAALRIDAHDEEGWSAALRRAAEDPELRGTLSAAGAERATRFTWSRSATHYVRAYGRALSR